MLLKVVMVCSLPLSILAARELSILSWFLQQRLVLVNGGRGVALSSLLVWFLPLLVAPLTGFISLDFVSAGVGRS